jgi:hypothetical protein
MVALTEGRHAAEFILSEAAGMRSRDNIVIASGAGKLAAGTIVGKVTASGKYVPSPVSGADGSQSAAAVTLYAVDATSADAPVSAITRDAEVNGKILTYDASVDQAAEKTAKHDQLAAAGIIVR